MWIYSATTATSAATTALSRTASESARTTESFYQTAANGTVTRTSVSDSSYASTYSATPYETRSSEIYGTTWIMSSGATQTDTATSYIVDESNGHTYGVTEERATEFSRLYTHWTSVETVTQSGVNGTITGSLSLTTSSTSSSESTFLATRGTYRSGTTTSTATGAATTTASTAATTTCRTGTAGGRTTTSTATLTLVTTTTAAETYTSTLYASAAARTLSAVEALVEITEAEASEDLWEITATADTAGFISELASTFTRRTGTLATASSVLPVVDSFVGSSDRTYSTTATAAPATVDTTFTTTSADTYVPFSSRYPATATATRSFTLLSVTTTTLAQASIRSTTVALASTATAAATATIRLTVSAGLAVNFNLSPTATTTALLGVTLATSTTLSDRPRNFSPATSASATVSAGSIQTTSISATSTTTATRSTTTTATTITGTYATTFTVFISSDSATDVCAIPPSTVTASNQADFIGYTNVAFYSTIHNAPSAHTLSTSAEQWQAYTIGATGTTTAASTASTSSTTTRTLAASFSNFTGSSSSAVEGVSFTTAQLHPQVTYDASASASVIAWRQGGGHQNPLSLGTATPLYTAQSAAGAFLWTDTARQMNRSGANAPILFTDARSFTSGATIATARYDTSDSAFHLTTAITTTTVTGTSTRRATSATGTLTASLQTQTAATYYSASIQTARTLIGGQAGNTAFAFTAILSPGVRHSTIQSAGASASTTIWDTGWLVVTGTSNGLALPMIAESAWSVTQQATAWNLFNKSEFIGSTGTSSRPIAVLSQYPSH